MGHAGVTDVVRLPVAREAPVGLVDQQRLARGDAADGGRGFRVEREAARQGLLDPKQVLEQAELLLLEIAHEGFELVEIEVGFVGIHGELRASVHGHHFPDARHAPQVVPVSRLSWKWRTAFRR